MITLIKKSRESWLIVVILVQKPWRKESDPLIVILRRLNITHLRYDKDKTLIPPDREE